MPESAAERLERAFAAKAEGAVMDAPRIGIFGDGLPDALVTAAGAVPLDIKASPDGVRPDPRVAPFVEPFMDRFAAGFLHRLAAGAFDGFAGLVFARDDTAGLTAYQYALELRRIGILPDGPPLHLWNLLHTDSAPVHRFNMSEAARLDAFLSDTTGHGFREGLEHALEVESRRLDAVERLALAGLPARTEFTWRNAGRWLGPEDHAGLIADAIGAATASSPGPVIGLIGSASIDPALYDMLDRIGRLSVDLQPYGHVWPAAHAGGPDLDGLIRAVATNPLHPRAAPAGCYRAALTERLANCDVVVAYCAPHEETLGWDLPSLSAALAAKGVPVVDLGFLPANPHDDWLAAAEARIRAAARVPA
ncbi:hypothetical protein HKCCE3408_11140 [Rhodobacterales bacterium HKCCE3408]|nr:hypothetical protein [Rhodobacterales bacterium HKCCE3408]